MEIELRSEVRMGRPKLPEDKVHKENVHVKMTGPWKRWLDGYARARKDSVARLIREALRYMARRDKYQPPPKDD